ncbi:MAG: helix-turn-helix transcriptional regulator [Oscillospiraceae bacterium]|nr:helix-turn-helix transcriptional regulator [Oscillospiraceae bacterium]
MIKGLPEKLRTMRKSFSYSQKEVADRLGVSPSIVSGYETGERTPSAEVLLSLSYLYKCSTDYLLGKQADSPQIVLDISDLTEKQIAALIQLTDSMRGS